jgi:hypothetical protein
MCVPKIEEKLILCTSATEHETLLSVEMFYFVADARLSRLDTSLSTKLTLTIHNE